MVHPLDGLTLKAVTPVAVEQWLDGLLDPGELVDAEQARQEDVPVGLNPGQVSIGNRGIDTLPRADGPGIGAGKVTVEQVGKLILIGAHRASVDRNGWLP
jgi:hypothetical protein